jgi:holliday junction DNA helicase RuvA
MISQLHGTIVFRGTSHIVLDVNGVGYKLNVSAETMEKLSSVGDDPITLSTYLAVRENALDLYGFLSHEALGFFELLITVSGIGPKTALTIMNLASVKTLRSAIATGDPAHLTKISGIGRKTAEKLTMELRGKFEEDAMETEDMQDENDALEALKGLGFSERQAREALKKLDKSVTGTSDKVKQAIKLLGK